MDIDTIIYIVVTIVIFIASLVGNKKPKPLPPQENTEDIDYSLNEFEKILERKEEFAKAQTNRTEDIEVVQEEHLSVADEYKQMVEEKVQKQEPFIQKKEEEPQKVQNEEVEDEADDGFDLNSAIIYSSILERKKFRH